jgi:hypothetical protein
MSFTTWVYSAERGCFPITVPDASIRARNLKALIAASGEIGTSTAALCLFLATEDGAKVEPRLRDLALITPTDGEATVWVDRVVEPAAGEFRGPGSWAWWGLCAGLGYFGQS